MKTAGITDAEKRRIMVYDLLIGVGIPVLQMTVGECAWPFAANWLFTRTQSRVRCFRKSLQPTRGFRPYLVFLEYSANLCPLSLVARGDWHCVSLLLWLV